MSHRLPETENRPAAADLDAWNKDAKAINAEQRLLRALANRHGLNHGARREVISAAQKR